jgi:hypothetical protein
MPEYRKKVSQASAFLPVVNLVNPASAFGHHSHYENTLSVNSEGRAIMSYLYEYLPKFHNIYFFAIFYE